MYINITFFSDHLVQILCVYSLIRQYIAGNYVHDESWIERVLVETCVEWPLS